MKKLVQFGAGNIGRSFIGQLFARSSHEVVFVDVSGALVRALNEKKEYRLVVKRNDREDEIIPVRNVRAVDGTDADAVARELADADFAATSVGKNALRFVFPNLARGIALRGKTHPGRPLDIIIAENIHGGAAYFSKELASLLPPDFPLGERIGLVETSIGKMVPIMRAEDLETDPLWVFSEEYNELIVDGSGFRGPLPAIPSLKPVADIGAYVDRKLFVHNMGHAAVAYLGHARDASLVFIWQALELPDVAEGAERAMRQSAAALVAEYPAVFTRESLGAHIADLLYRFRNRALGDTMFRVGRDLGRKLDKSDRLIGAALLAEKHGLPWDGIEGAIRAAVDFRGTDEWGNLFPADAVFASNAEGKTIEEIVKEAGRLDERVPEEKKVIERFRRKTSA